MGGVTFGSPRPVSARHLEEERQPRSVTRNTLAADRALTRSLQGFEVVQVQPDRRAGGGET
jgi:hypothetical protein